jgi:hypothetical protein
MCGCESIASLLVILWSLAPMAAHAEVLYGITFDEQLIRINTTTGAGTLVGNLSSEMKSLGLGNIGTSLYAFDQIADVIRQLNPATGATIATINIGIGNVVGEGGLALRRDGIGFLATSAGSTGRFYSFNIVSGTSTPITGPGGFDPAMDGLDFSPGGVLFGIRQDPSVLYTIEPVTGATTLIGDTGFNDNDAVSGLAFRSDGVLFGEVNGILVTIDPLTGAATVIGRIGFANVSGLIFLPVPGPSTVLLLGMGVLAIAAMQRRANLTPAHSICACTSRTAVMAWMRKAGVGISTW